jgi:Xaa-Pro aminopeptidase
MKSDFFVHNRKRFIESIGGGVAVLTAYTATQRSNDMSFRFEQEANFWYLTGVEAADWWVIIDGIRGKSWLVAPDVEEIHKIFDGETTHDDMQKRSGADGVLSRDDGEKLLQDLAKKHSVVRTLNTHPQGERFGFVENPAQKWLSTNLERLFNAVHDCRRELARLRAIKQPEEITAIKKAIRLTTQAFEHVGPKLSNLAYEYEVEAEFDYYFAKQGAKHAYDAIVAGGKNACTLHYVANNARLKRPGLLLLDIGARVDGYAADISRTFAIGQATHRQQEVHQAVQSAHKAIVSLLKPGLSVKDYADSVDTIMKEALLDLRLLTSKNDEAFRNYFPHSVSHGLGIDVHDSLGGPEEFKPGMVLTVEPGIYIPKEGIGVRIEDDILITDKGHTNLSGSLSTEL